MIADRIDLASLADRADLPAILEADGHPVRRGSTTCPFHDDQNPSLSVYHRDGRWRFKCHGCPASGDAIAYVQLRDRLDSPIAAAYILDPSLRPAGSPKAIVAPRPAPEPKPKPPPRPRDWQDPAWQSAADELIKRAEATLWGDEGRDARRWLRGRGLRDATCRRFRLGFAPGSMRSDPLAVLDQGEGPQPIWVPRGITLPWVHPEAWYSIVDGEPPARWVGANVRRLMPDVDEPMPKGKKNKGFAGSERGHGYPFGEILPSQRGMPLLATEGELDSLLAWQEIGPLAIAMTIGGASQQLLPGTFAAIDRCEHWLVATDHDASGDRAWHTFAKASPQKVARMYLPHGNDIGDFVQAGGDLRAWFAGELKRLGIAG